MQSDPDPEIRALVATMTEASNAGEYALMACLGRDHLDHPDLEVAITAHSVAAQAASAALDIDAGDRLSRRGLELATQSTERQLLATALLTRAMCSIDLGEMDDARDLARRTTSLATEPWTRYTALCLLELLDGDQSNPESVVRQARNNTRVAIEAGLPLLSAISRLRLAITCSIYGHADEADALLALAAPDLPRYWRAWRDLMLVSARPPGEDEPSTVACLEQCIAIFDATQDLSRKGAACMELGRRLRGRGDPAAALPWMRQAVELADRRRDPYIRHALSHVLHQLGRHDEADAETRRVLSHPAVSDKVLGFASAAALSLAAVDGDWQAWDTAWARHVQHVRSRGARRDYLLEDGRRALARTREHGGGPRREVRAASIALRQSGGAPEDVRPVHLLARSGAPIPCGHRWLTRQVGAGGTGAVWATDEGEAVKFVHAAALRNPANVAGFHRELRALATLNHPGIVSIRDHGTSDDVVAVMTQGRIPKGSPWLAMPLADGTLSAACGQVEWAEARAVLSALLDALGFAHAVGVLHLDLKPANVLHIHGRWVLADFGTARWASQAEAGPRQGSPAWMAPEQFDLHWRELGAHTDLYALGCLATTLVTGAPPFFANSIDSWQAAHTHRVPPPLDPDAPVPVGFQAWLDRLLEKDPRERWPDAASARAALEALPEASPSRSGAPEAQSDAEDTFAFGPDPTQSEPTAPSALLPHRELPLLGRETEQEALVDHLQAAASGRCLSVVVRAREGFGAARLAHWVGVHAATRGIAASVAVDAGPAPVEVRLARCLLRAGGLEGASLESHLQRTVWRPTRLSIADALAAVAGDPGGLAALVVARNQPLVVVLNDAGSHDLEDLTSALASRAVAVLAVTHAAPGRPVPAGAHTIDVGPLGDAHLARLADLLVPLAPTLRERLVERARGNPGWLIATIRDWKSRRVLERTDTGWSVAEVELDRAAESGGTHPLESLWTTPADREALERLAVLGAWASPERIERAGAGLRSALAERLEREGVLERGPETWWLANDLRDVLLARAADGARLGEHHRACAAALGDARDPRALAALGRHLLAGGQAEAALEPLERALASEVGARVERLESDLHAARQSLGR